MISWSIQLNVTIWKMMNFRRRFYSFQCKNSPCAGYSGSFYHLQHVSVEEKYAQGYKKRYGKDGFMMLISSSQDLVSGEPGKPAIAVVNIEKFDQQGGNIRCSMNVE